MNIVAATLDDAAPHSPTRAKTRSKEKLWDALFSMIHYCGRMGVPDTVYVMFAAHVIPNESVVRSEPVGWRGRR